MSGGGGGDSKGNRSRTYGREISINKSALSKNIAAGPARNANAGNRSPGGIGERKIEVGGVEPPAAVKPQSQGPSGIDTGGAGTDSADPQSILARTQAARRRRQAMARGGGLSNVAVGGATLG
jgi:hypothetical protein